MGEGSDREGTDGLREKGGREGKQMLIKREKRCQAAAFHSLAKG